MTKPLEENTFEELVDAGARSALDRLLTEGGSGLKSAMWAYMNTAINWAKGKEPKQEKRFQLQQNEEDNQMKEYTVEFFHHGTIRTRAVVQARNDIEGLALAFEQLISEGWNTKGELSWCTTGGDTFKIKITGHVLDEKETQ